MNAEGLRLFKQWVMGFYKNYNCLPDCLEEMNEFADPEWTPEIEMLDAGCTRKQIADIDRHYQNTMLDELEDEILADEMDAKGFAYHQHIHNPMNGNL